MPARMFIVDPATGLWTRATGSGETITPPNPGLIHPGVMYSEAQLAQLATDVQDPGTNDRKSTYATLLTRTASIGANTGVAYSSTGWTPHPVPVVKRYQATSYTDVGDLDLIADGVAAVVHALIWRATGTRANASKACAILNAWSSTITGIQWGWPESATVSADGKLLAGWTAALFAQAGEIMSYSGWTAGVGETALDVDNLKRVLQDIWLPILIPAEVIGQHNWYASVINGLMQAAVFLDDKTTYAAAKAYWRQVIKSVMWMPGDTNQIPAMAASTPPASGLPIVPDGSRYNVSSVTRASILSYWQNPTSWPDGLSGELGRDFHHNAMIFALMGYAAETAYLQGDDLWSEEQARIVTATELFADVLRDIYVSGGSPSTWPFSKVPTDGSYTTSTQRTTFELLYMAYATRRGVSMPNTAALLSGYVRPSTYLIDTGPGIIAEGLMYRDNPGA